MGCATECEEQYCKTQCRPHRSVLMRLQTVQLAKTELLRIRLDLKNRTTAIRRLRESSMKNALRLNGYSATFSPLVTVEDVVIVGGYTQISG